MDKIRIKKSASKTKGQSPTKTDGIQTPIKVNEQTFNVPEKQILAPLTTEDKKQFDDGLQKRKDSKASNKQGENIKGTNFSRVTAQNGEK